MAYLLIFRGSTTPSTGEMTVLRRIVEPGPSGPNASAATPGGSPVGR